jgi:hypothetical protein
MAETKVFFFFFFGHESLPDSNPSTTTNTVPTDAERKGDFSAPLPLGCPNGYLGTDYSHCANGSANPYQLYRHISGHDGNPQTDSEQYSDQR